MFQTYLALSLLACVLVCQAYRVQDLLPNMDSYKMYDYDESFEEKSLLHLLRDQYKNEISNIEHKRYSICGARGCQRKTGRNKSRYQKVAAKRFIVCGPKGCKIE